MRVCKYRPEVSVFQRAVADALSAIILSILGASYFFVRASRTSAILYGLKWYLAFVSAFSERSYLICPGRATVSVNMIEEVELKKKSQIEGKSKSGAKKYRKFKVRVSNERNPFKQR